MATPLPGVYYKPEHREPLKREVHGEDGRVIAKEIRAAKRIVDTPLFKEVTEENFVVYKETGLPIAYLVDELASLEKYE